MVKILLNLYWNILKILITSGTSCCVPKYHVLVNLYLSRDDEETVLQNICRYYPCKDGGKLVKIMPPLEEGGELRRMGIDTSWNVLPCNNMDNFDIDKIDIDYYVEEASKLLIGVDVG